MSLFSEPEPLVYTIEETARLLRMSRAKVYQLAERGDIPAIRIGRSVRIPREKLRDWMETVMK